MRVLAFDTTSRGCSVALWFDGQKHYSLNEDIDRGHSHVLPLMFEKVLSQCALKDVDLILTNVGPGSFTGIRVGLAFGYGVSQSSGVPFKGVNSFDVWSCAAGDGLPDDGVVILDAKRSDVYVRLSSEPESLRPEQLRDRMGDRPRTLIGDGVSQVFKSDSHQHQVLTPAFTGADAVAHTYYKKPDFFAQAEPFYLRSADVSQPRTV